MTTTTATAQRPAPSSIRVRWHRPTRLWFVDRQEAGGWRTMPHLPAYRSLHKAMTSARLVAKAAAPRHVEETPC